MVQLTAVLSESGALTPESARELNAAPDDAHIVVRMCIEEMNRGRSARSLEQAVPQLRRFRSFDCTSLFVDSWAGLEGLMPIARLLLLSEGDRAARSMWPDIIAEAKVLETLLLMPGWRPLSAELERLPITRFGLRRGELDDDAFLGDAVFVELWRVRLPFDVLHLPAAERAEIYLSSAAWPPVLRAPRLGVLDFVGHRKLDNIPQLRCPALSELWIQDVAKVRALDLTTCPELRHLFIHGATGLDPADIAGISQVTHMSVVMGTEKQSEEFVRSLGVPHRIDWTNPSSRVDFSGFHPN
ncbi:hypothetical protein [Calidifontibacter terrae]